MIAGMSTSLQIDNEDIEVVNNNCLEGSTINYKVTISQDICAKWHLVGWQGRSWKRYSDVVMCYTKSTKTCAYIDFFPYDVL